VEEVIATLTALAEDEEPVRSVITEISSERGELPTRQTEPSRPSEATPAQVSIRVTMPAARTTTREARAWTRSLGAVVIAGCAIGLAIAMRPGPPPEPPPAPLAVGSHPPEPPTEPSTPEASPEEQTDPPPSLVADAGAHAASGPERHPGSHPRPVPRDKAPPPIRHQDPSDLTSSVEQALERRGLTFADLEAIPEARRTVAEWRAALQAGAAPAASEATTDLLRVVDATPVDGALVRRKLERVSQRLTEAARVAPGKDNQEVQQLEDRYLDLADRHSRVLTPGGELKIAIEAEHLLHDIASLERRFKTAPH
jgi:hypothetical protein